MRTSGIFKVHAFKIKLAAGTACRIIPFGDVHRDSDSHAKKPWQDFLKYAARQTDAYFLGMGDFVDGFSTSERAILSDGHLHETSQRNFERQADAQVKRLAKELRPLEGRIIGLLGGNHYFSFSDGTDSDQRLARELKCRYLGACAAIRLLVKGSITPHSGVHRVDIAAHHGRGAARTIGGSLAGVQKLMDCFDCDIHLMGDDHKVGCCPVGQRLQIVRCPGTDSGYTVTSRTPWIGRTGSFTRGYEQDIGSYVVDAAFPPTSLGWIEFTIRLMRKPDSGGHRELSIEGATKLA